MITIDQEVNMVWKKKWTAATWLFMTNRYLLVSVMVLANVHATAQTSVYYRASLKYGTHVDILLVVLAWRSLYRPWKRHSISYFPVRVPCTAAAMIDSVRPSFLCAACIWFTEPHVLRNCADDHRALFQSGTTCYGYCKLLHNIYPVLSKLT